MDSARKVLSRAVSFAGGGGTGRMRPGCCAPVGRRRAGQRARVAGRWPVEVTDGQREPALRGMLLAVSGALGHDVARTWGRAAAAAARHLFMPQVIRTPGGAGP